MPGEGIPVFPQAPEGLRQRGVRATPKGKGRRRQYFAGTVWKFAPLPKSARHPRAIPHFTWVLWGAPLRPSRSSAPRAGSAQVGPAEPWKRGAGGAALARPSGSARRSLGEKVPPRGRCPQLHPRRGAPPAQARLGSARHGSARLGSARLSSRSLEQERAPHSTVWPVRKTPDTKQEAARSQSTVSRGNVLHKRPSLTAAKQRSRAGLVVATRVNTSPRLLDKSWW
ncbi:uncharacterized protein LOC110363627 [Columba livia]|uniref:uncharacterized protein LOC110363627 n=1 Tax=Columba livia TaxID=8932 RepID=UPI0031BB9871